MAKSWRLILAKLFNSIIMTIQAICDCCRRVQELCSRAVGYINNLLAEWFVWWKLLAGILESVSRPAGLRLASCYLYPIPWNNSRPSINRLPRIIVPPRPSSHFLFLSSPACQVEVQCDPAKLSSDQSSN